MTELREMSGVTEIGAIQLREVASGPITEIGEIWLREASGLTLVWSISTEIEATPNNLEVYGSRAREETIAVTTFATIVSVTGGTPPYTHSWARTDGGSGTWEIVHTDGTARFRRSCAPGDNFTATFADTVTDARGNTATTADVQATVENFGGLVGGTL